MSTDREDRTTRSMLHMTAPLRDAFDIPYHDIGPRDAEPEVAFVAGVHGNEINGVFTLARLAAYLRGVAQGKHRDQELRARVVIVPAVNVLGINTQSRVWPFDKTDINRMFPGYDAGETTQRIAAAALHLTLPARYRIDIHSSNVDFEELPQVRLYDPSDAERRTARLFGLPAVIERRGDSVFTVTMGHAWRQRQGENFVLQIGQAGSLQPPHCEALFQALVNFLARRGVLAGVALADDDEHVHHFGRRQTCSLIAESAGMFVTKAEVGRWLQAGAVLGHIFDGFDGELREEVRTPVAGLLSGIRRQPLLYQGNLIARVLTRLEMETESDPTLGGFGQ